MDLVDTISRMRHLFFLVPVGLLGGACQSPQEDTAVERPTEVISEAGVFRVSWTSSPDPIVPVELFSIVFEIEESATNVQMCDTARASMANRSRFAVGGRLPLSLQIENARIAEAT